MTQEEKQLLFNDLCGRLPHCVKCAVFDKKIGFWGQHAYSMDGISVEPDGIDIWLEKGNFSIEIIKPYLRPMSSMTEEEKSVWFSFMEKYQGVPDDTIHFNKINDYQDWLNAHHFDYRGLIEKGLAIEAPEDMYTKNDKNLDS